MTGWSVPGYTQVRELGKGGAGQVVLATHDATGTAVAIKYVADQLIREPSFLGDFRSEAEALATVESPHITRLYEYLESGDHAAIVMELVNGVSLRSLIRERGPLEPEAALTVLKGSLQGLATAHRRRIVHRDFKPANVLVDTDGHSKLADFGLATRSGKVGVLAGTPSYMAPEQWNGAPAAPQTDIYAATATFFECLTGRPPFRIEGIPDVLRLQGDHEIPVERAPEPVRGLLRWGLAAEPANRPRDAGAFLRELEKVAGSAYGDGWEQRGWQQLARRVALLALLLPNPPARPSTTSFALTRLGRPAMTLVAMVILVAAVVAGTMARSGWLMGDSPAADAAAVLPPVVLAAPSPMPSPSSVPGPSPSATPSHTNSATPTHTASPPAAPSPSVPPTPVIDRLSVGADLAPSGCLGGKCLVEWMVTIGGRGTGPAVLDVLVYPVDANGGQQKPSASWHLPFEVTGPSETWPESPDRSVALYIACQQQYEVVVEATVTVGTKVVMTEAKPLRCPLVVN